MGTPVSDPAFASLAEHREHIVSSPAEKDAGQTGGKQEKRLSFTLAALAGLTFLYPAAMAAAFFAGLNADNADLAYGALQAVLLLDHFRWVQEYWSALPAALISAALAIDGGKRALLIVGAAFVAVAVFNSLWLGWLSGIDVQSSEFTSIFIIHNINISNVDSALSDLELLVTRTRDLAVTALGGGAGVSGGNIARGKFVRG